MEMDINPENCVLVKGCTGISIEKLIINFQRRGFVGEFGIDVDDSKSRMVDDDEALLYLTDKDAVIEVLKRKEFVITDHQRRTTLSVFPHSVHLAETNQRRFQQDENDKMQNKSAMWESTSTPTQGANWSPLASNFNLNETLQSQLADYAVTFPQGHRNGSPRPPPGYQLYSPLPPPGYQYNPSYQCQSLASPFQQGIQDGKTAGDPYTLSPQGVEMQAQGLWSTERCNFAADQTRQYQGGDRSSPAGSVTKMPITCVDDSFSEDSETKEDECAAIEASGFDKGTTESTIRNFFGNKKRSGGGAIKDFEMTKDRKAIITYKDIQTKKNVVAKGILVLDNAQIRIRAVDSKKLHAPIDKSRVFITGFRRNQDKDHLETFLENISGGIAVKEFVYGDKEGSAMVVYETDVDLKKIQQRSERRPLHKGQQDFLTAVEVTIPDTILVYNLNPKTSKDALSLHFESCEGSDSAEVADVEIDSRHGESAKVTFTEYSAVQCVLAREHLLDSHRLTLQEYYTCLGVTKPGTDRTRPQFRLPDPIEFELDADIRGFLEKVPNQLVSLKSYLKKQEAKFDLMKKNKVMISCTLNAEDEDVHQKVENWMKNMDRIKGSVVERFLVQHITVLQEVMESMQNKLAEKKIVDTNCLMIIVHKQECSIRVVGLRQEVKDCTEKIKAIMKELHEMMRRKAQKISETVTLKKFQLRFLMVKKFKGMVKQGYKDLSVDLNTNTGELKYEGLPEDIQASKLQMYEMLQNIETTKLQLSEVMANFLTTEPARCHYVQCLKNANELQAVLDNDSGQVLIHSSSKQENEKAQLLLKQTFSEELLNVESGSQDIIGGQKWTGISDALTRQHNELVKIIPKHDRSRINIVGVTSISKNVSKQLTVFLEKNTILTTTIQLCTAKARFLKNIKASELQGIKTKLADSYMTFEITDSGIVINGTRFGLGKAKSEVEQMLDALIVKRNPMKTPGMTKMFKEDKGREFLSKAENECRCAIEVNFPEVTENAKSPAMADTNSNRPMDGSVCSSMLPNGVKLSVFKADLTRHKVDIIVNASNAELKHIGGLAGALVSAGGKKIQEESHQFIAKLGRNLLPGQIAWTSAGSLPCEMVIHAVGPIWQGGNSNEERYLKAALFESLKKASEGGFTSIAIPAISSGVYGYPIKKCSQVIVTTLKEFCQETPRTSLKDIHLVDSSDKTVNQFRSDVAEIVGKDLGNMKATSSAATAMGSGDVAKGIILFKGKIADFKADVIVNTTSQSLQLNQGGVSSSILTKGGTALQLECNKRYPNGIQFGDIAVTPQTGSLNCVEVYHGALPNWKSEIHNKKILNNFIENCLNTASKKRKCSIALPALGTGKLGYPRETVAKLMKECIEEWRAKNQQTTLQQIYCVLFPSDTDTVKAFEKIFQGARKKTKKSQWSQNGSTKTSTNATSIYSNFSQKNVHDAQMQVGQVFVQVQQGDITKETTDIIVNSTNSSLDLSGGAVSKALVKACGQTLLDECSSLGGTTNGIAVTSAGNLQRVKKIIHVDAPRDDPKQWRQLIYTTLKEAESLQLKSIAFPAIGTGQCQAAATDIASIMLDAIADFYIKEKPQSLLLVRITIYEGSMLPDFLEVMKKKIGTAPTDSRNRIHKAASWLMTKVFGAGAEDTAEYDHSVTVMTIYSESDENIEAAVKMIEAYARREIINKTMEDDSITKLSQEQVDKIQALQKELDIKVDVERSQYINRILIQGLPSDVMKANDVIHSILRDIVEKEKVAAEDKAVANEVQWYYIEDNEDKVKFDIGVNAEIEKAYRTNPKLEFTYQLDGKLYNVNFSEMKEYPAGSKEVYWRIQRQDLKAKLPATWSPMPPTNPKVHLVTLLKSSPEYQSVSSEFLKSVGGTIVKIERIQNPTLYQQYIVKKNDMEQTYSQASIVVEDTLWHGTSDNGSTMTIDSINNNGFNRSYCGRNATVYGKGVYFAKEAQYSHRYTTPDVQGMRHIYMSRVLTGHYIQGNGNMLVAPNRSGSIPYDSVVDNPSNPSIFVIFSDTTAYPEYLITYQ